MKRMEDKKTIKLLKLGLGKMRTLLEEPKTKGGNNYTKRHHPRQLPSPT